MIKKQVDSVDRSRSRAETFILVLALAMIAGIVVVVCAFGVNFIAGTANPVGDSSPASSSDALNPGRNAAVTLDSQATISVTGDVIGHMSMVKAAYDADTDSYDFNNIFTKENPALISFGIDSINAFMTLLMIFGIASIILIIIPGRLSTREVNNTNPVSIISGILSRTSTASKLA